VASVSVDTIIQTDGEILFSAPVGDRTEIAAVLDGLGGRWEERGDLGKVSVVGAGMKSHPGIAAQTFSLLRELGVEPKLVATSPIKIAFYVPHEDVERTVRALHDGFDLAAAGAERGHA
jgi:aspartate kinase